MTKQPVPKFPCKEFRIPLSETTGSPVSDLYHGIRQCSHPSFNGWTDHVRLVVDTVNITRSLLDEVIAFLNLPLVKDPSGNSDKEYRWIWVNIIESQFAYQHNTPSHWDKGDCCTLDDIHRLFYALAHRAFLVLVYKSPTIVSDVLSIADDDDHLEVDTLRIVQNEKLSARKCSKLGRMIQRNVDLGILELSLPFGDGAHGLFEGFADGIKLRELKLGEMWGIDVQRKDVADLVVGESSIQKGIDGPVIRLLRNPQNQLKSLSLRNMGLKDHHLIVLLRMMPTSQIEHLTFSYNSIQVQGMLEFASLLPRMHSLKSVDFARNSWAKSPFTNDDRKKIGAALLQGLMENTCIESMHGIASTPQAQILWQYVAMNRARRRLLASSQPIPDGLWPIVLARACKFAMRYSVVAWDMKYDSGYSSTTVTSANAVFYFLRNCPKILSFRSSNE